LRIIRPFRIRRCIGRPIILLLLHRMRCVLRRRRSVRCVSRGRCDRPSRRRYPHRGLRLLLLKLPYL
jgi:hypothetical protein